MISKEVPTARLFAEMENFMLLTKRILDLNKDKDKLWQEYQEYTFLSRNVALSL